jgi:hypothetical protein
MSGYTTSLQCPTNSRQDMQKHGSRLHMRVVFTFSASHHYCSPMVWEMI